MATSSFFNQSTDSLIDPLTHLEVSPRVPPRIIRICLIVCGHFTKKLKDDNGDYVEMYSKWLQASLPKHTNVKFQLDGYEAQDQQYPKRNKLDEYDAVLVSGSRKCRLQCWSAHRQVFNYTDVP